MTIIENKVGEGPITDEAGLNAYLAKFKEYGPDSEFKISELFTDEPGRSLLLAYPQEISVKYIEQCREILKNAKMKLLALQQSDKEGTIVDTTATEDNQPDM